MDYLYDGTFEGYLTCIYYHYKKEKASNIFDISSYQQTLMNDFEIVETDKSKAETVSEAIINKISREAYADVYICFLSCDENKENIILEFLKFAFIYGSKTMNFYSHDKVLPLNQVVLKVYKEEHRFLGILRFSDIDGILYAKFSPDNDLLVLLVDHFGDRYKFEKFIIHDEKRNKAVFYTQGSWEVIEKVNIGQIDLSQDEKSIHNLWKQYFTSVAIKERTNINLQTQFVPNRYRKNMTEFNE